MRITRLGDDGLPLTPVSLLSAAHAVEADRVPEAKMSKSIRIVSAGVLAACVGTLVNQIAGRAAEQQVRVHAPPPSLTEQIAGTWQLAWIYQEDEGGEEVDQFGGFPQGMFMADRQGNFSFQIMNNRGRRIFANSPPAVVMARSDGLLEAVSSGSMASTRKGAN